jgi:cytochrome P450
MNFFSEDTRRNPFPLYDQMRSHSPVLHVPQLDLWMIFDYDGVKRTLNDHVAFSSSMCTAKRANPPWFIFFDAPQHTKLRALVMRAFTPRMVANLESRIRDLSRELLDQTIERGEMDLASDFSFPLPMMVISEMLGVSIADRPPFTRWSDVMLGLSFVVPGGEAGAKASKDFFAVKGEMGAYLAGLLAERRATPRDDLLTKLVQAEVDGERLTDEEILGFFQLLLIAGTETTTNLLNNAILCLTENQDQLARLRATPICFRPRSKKCCGTAHPCSGCSARPSRRSKCAGKRFPPGSWCCRLSARRTATLSNSQIPTALTSHATLIPISRSGTASTSAWAHHSRAWRPGSLFPIYWSG